MRCADLVEQLRRKVPLLTDLFSDSIAISSIIHTGTTATVTTAAAHGLAVGQAPTIFGARTPVAVASIAHVPGETVATVTTSEDHDLTLYRTFKAGNVVEVAGANEAQFNGQRVVVGVPNRRTIRIEVDAGAPASATGAVYLLGASNYFRNVRGLYAVQTVPSPTSFTITHAAASNLGTLVGPAFLRTPPRITGVMNAAGADASYSLEAGASAPKPWLFAMIEDSVAVRDKAAPAEGYSVNQLSAGWSQMVIQPFRVLVALPNTGGERGRSARDVAADLVAVFCRALVGARFATGFARSQPLTFATFTGDEGQSSDVGPYYVHAYGFEQVAQLTMGDTVGNDEHVAFRDIDLSIGNDVGDAVVESAIDLDDEPL